MGSQNASQRNPIAPVRMNAHCQPRLIAIQGTVSGATTAPTLVPALKMPVANARSFLGNHSATPLIAAGKLPASPSPRSARQSPNWIGVLASAVTMPAMLQIVSATA